MNKLVLSCLLLGVFTISLKSDTVTLYAENDCFCPNNYDKYYTHGSRISYVDNNLVDKAYSYSVGQYIYTPADKESTEIIEGDRPYCGYLYFEPGLYLYRDNYMTYFYAQIGTVGPQSYAEESQTAIHKLIGNKIPKGWDNQISDENIINLGFSRKYRLPINKHVDLIPSFFGCLGNGYSGVGIGNTLRLGWNLPKDFGIHQVEPTIQINRNTWFNNFKQSYIYAHTDGRYVGRNITLDGNTFKDSYHVNHEEYVSDLEIGAVLYLCNRVNVSYAYITRSKEFTTQDYPEAYGSVKLIIVW